MSHVRLAPSKTRGYSVTDSLASLEAARCLRALTQEVEIICFNKHVVCHFRQLVFVSLLATCRESTRLFEARGNSVHGELEGEEGLVHFPVFVLHRTIGRAPFFEEVDLLEVKLA